MLKKNIRINKKYFDLIYKRGKFFKKDIFFINYLPNRKTYSQFAVIVSLKTQKSAVKRNWMRRIVKAMILKQINNIPAGYFIVISIKKTISVEEKNQKLSILSNILSNIPICLR